MSWTDRSRCPYALAGAVLLALSACGGGGERSRAERLIRAYDRAVIEAHLTATFAELEKIASRDELDRLQVIVGGMRLQRQTLVASLEALSVEEASFDAARKVGTAIATERWMYERVQSRTREPAGQPVHREYTLRYEFVLRGNGWMVDRVRHEQVSREWRG